MSAKAPAKVELKGDIVDPTKKSHPAFKQMMTAIRVLRSGKSPKEAAKAAGMSYDSLMELARTERYADDYRDAKGDHFEALLFETVEDLKSSKYDFITINGEKGPKEVANTPRNKRLEILAGLLIKLLPGLKAEYKDSPKAGININNPRVLVSSAETNVRKQMKRKPKPINEKDVLA